MADILSTLAKRSSVMPWFQLLLCFVTVFVGLICIVIICKIIGAFCKGAAKKETTAAAPPAADAKPQNSEEIIAAVTAACAEEMGKDVKGLRVVSFKKI